MRLILGVEKWGLIICIRTCKPSLGRILGYNASTSKVSKRQFRGVWRVSMVLISEWEFFRYCFCSSCMQRMVLAILGGVFDFWLLWFFFNSFFFSFWCYRYHANRMLSFYAPGGKNERHDFSLIFLSLRLRGLISFVSLFVMDIYLGWCGEVRGISFSADGRFVTVIYRVTIKGSDGEVCYNNKFFDFFYPFLSVIMCVWLCIISFLLSTLTPYMVFFIFLHYCMYN